MTKQQKIAIRTRVLSVLYLGAVGYIIIRDIPRGTASLLNILVIFYVVLFNMLLAANSIFLAIKQRVLSVFNALYISALVGFFLSFVAYSMARAAGQPIDASSIVFGLTLLYVAVYTVVLAGRGVWIGRV